jgi:replicative DNA helicase
MAEYLRVDREAVAQTLQRKVSMPDVEAKRQEIASALPANEKLLISCLLLSADARTAVVHYLRATDILHLLEARAIFEAVLAIDETAEPFSLEKLAGRLELRSRKILTEIGFADLSITEENAAGQALDCLRSLEMKSISADENSLKRRIRELEQQGNITEALRLMNELDLRKGPPAKA